MERTDFKKASYCRIKISYAMERIAYANKVKGIGPGTFWLDIEGVEKYVKGLEDYIEALNKRIDYLSQIHHQ